MSPAIRSAHGPPIVLLSDFGYADWFAGTMKGVIHTLSPGATIIDLTHGIARGDIAAGAFALAAGCPYFPPGTIFVAVVDPGVGSPRPALAALTGRFFFAGPDNGLLSLALAAQEVKRVVRLENRRFFLEPVSRTFHGRDIFAPVAAHLRNGLRLDELGSGVRSWRKLPFPAARRAGGGLRGAVVYVDQFGNAITNIRPSHLANRPLASWRIRVGGQQCPIRTSYSSLAAGVPGGIFGSTGFLEIALRNGSAAREFGLRPGTRVVLR